MIAASYQEALVTFRDLCDDGLEPEGIRNYSEYARGGINLIADLFPVYELDVGTRMDQVLEDLRKIPMHADPFKLDEYGVIYNFFPIT